MKNKPCHLCGTPYPQLHLVLLMGTEAAEVCPDCFEDQTGILPMFTFHQNKHYEKQTPERMDGPSPSPGTAGVGHHQNHRKI